MGEKITKVDEFIRWCKNHRLISILLFVCLIIIGLGQLTDALEKIHTFFKPSPEVLTSATRTNTANIAKPVHDQYNFPGKYQGASFSLIGEGECLENSVVSEDRVEFRFVIKNSAVLMDLSPLVVRILRPDSATSRTMIYQDIFSFKAGTNIVSIPIKLPAGHYVLEYGFFLTSESGSEFQKCYQTVCDFRRL
ncbi:MAG: hypothetical protein ABSG80_01460 [Verrucomicrobiota bacterium]|jgi:hypothetical protein